MPRERSSDNVIDLIRTMHSRLAWSTHHRSIDADQRNFGSATMKQRKS